MTCTSTTCGGPLYVRLALADAAVPQIATFTGHSLRDVEAILDKHYLGRDVRLAEDAVRKLERKEKRTKTLKVPVKCVEASLIKLGQVIDKCGGRTKGLEPWTR